MCVYGAHMRLSFLGITLEKRPSKRYIEVTACLRVYVRGLEARPTTCSTFSRRPRTFFLFHSTSVFDALLATLSLSALIFGIS